MLAKILANYLQINEQQAQSILDITALEAHFSREQKWQENVYTASAIKTQADFIRFLQAVGQSQWFKGHDRSKFADNITDEQLNKTYYEYFKRAGLVDAVQWPLQQPPHFAAVLGSSQSQVSDRVDWLKKDMLAGNAPSEKMIAGLGCNRDLGVGVMESEEPSKSRLLAAYKPLTEMEMTNLVTQDMLAEFSGYTYTEVNTATNVTNRTDKDCVKTSDTAASLKQAIEQKYDMTKLPDPIYVATYSCQPFVLRQQRDVQAKLGPRYQAIGVGREVSEERFAAHPKSIAICLGELARLMNINFNPAMLNKFDVALNADEMQELAQLSQPLPGIAGTRNSIFGERQAPTSNVVYVAPKATMF